MFVTLIGCHFFSYIEAGGQVIVKSDLVPTKMRREDLPAGDVLCDHCSAKCCRYFALPIEEPTAREDWEFVRWYLLHDAATVFMEEGDWYLLVHTECKHLQSDNRCGIYHTRPTICQEYSTNDCEYEDDWLYDRYLETAEQAGEYAEAVLPREKGQSIRSPKPPLLPVLAM
jgi:Fe-S-cluster containining protein